MRLYTDASCDGEIAGFGWEIIISDYSIEGNRFIFEDCTSMEAEYYALLDGLRFARRHGTDKIEVFSDCEPLIEKMRTPDSNKEWRDRRKGCHRLLNKFDTWELEWTPRSTNSRADRLAYEALEKGRQS